MSTVNTGNIIVFNVKKVRADITDPLDPLYQEPIDDNGVPTRLSEQPQGMKVNYQTDPDYIAPYENLDSCPLPAPELNRTIDNRTEKPNIYQDTVGGAGTTIPSLSTAGYGFNPIKVILHHDLTDVPIYVYDGSDIGSQVDTVSGDGETTQSVAVNGRIQIGGVLDSPYFKITNNSPRGSISFVFTPTADPGATSQSGFLAAGEPPIQQTLYGYDVWDVHINIGSFPDDIDYSIAYTDAVGSGTLDLIHGSLEGSITNLQANIHLTLFETPL